MDIIFDFTTANNRRVSVIGTMTRPLTVTTTGPVDLLGIRFRPGGLSEFLALDAAELTDARADLANFWGRKALETWHRLGEATLEERVRLMQQVLAKRANRHIRTDPFIRHCVARIEAARGGVRIRDLEKSTGLGTRQLERKFSQHLGISPKTFARVIRFRGVEEAASEMASPDWAELAGTFGFADQPHLVREFKTFTGESPTRYRDAIGGFS